MIDFQNKIKWHDKSDKTTSNYIKILIHCFKTNFTFNYHNYLQKYAVTDPFIQKQIEIIIIFICMSFGAHYKSVKFEEMLNYQLTITNLVKLTTLFEMLTP